MSDNNGVNWVTVGAAWGLCTLTTVVILFGLFGLGKFKWVNKKRSAKRDSLHKNHSIVVETEYVIRGESSRSSSVSRQALLKTSRQNSTSDTGQCSRRSSDYTSQWCTEHGLSELTAAVLRRQGFLYEATLLSLTSDVVPTLGLHNKGQECLLIKVIAQQNKTADVVTSGASRPLRMAPVEERPRSYHLSSSDKVMPGSVEPLKSPARAPLLERSQSDERLHKTPGMVCGAPLRKKSTQNIMDETDAGVTVPENDKSLLRQSTGNPKGFNGMLSDKGLYGITHRIGHEWPHLATMLEISTSRQEQIRMDNPNSTEQQIFKMLLLWRDTARGNKELVKGTLYTALVKVHRNDIADNLMEEQVHGSNEGVAYSSIIQPTAGSARQTQKPGTGNLHSSARNPIEPVRHKSNCECGRGGLDVAVTTPITQIGNHGANIDIDIITLPRDSIFVRAQSPKLAPNGLTGQCAFFKQRMINQFLPNNCVARVAGC